MNIAKIEINGLKDLPAYLSAQNNAHNFTYLSNIPQICKDEPCMLGIDEAGRGPVLGPMVYGIAYCPLADEDAILTTLGCADSKQLTEEKRDNIFDEMNKNPEANSLIGWAVEVISPNVISTCMNRRSKHSLNEVSMNSAIGLINRAIEAGVNIAKVFVDTVGPPEKYEAKLSVLFPDFDITVAKKADSTYPIVSAASICAKVTRDHALKVWKFAEKIDATYEQFGSGYPGDPKTKAFLQDYVDPLFGFTRLVRFSWSTATNALDSKAFDVRFDDVDSVENKKYKSTASVKKFFKADDRHVQCDYFKERFLSAADDL